FLHEHAYGIAAQVSTTTDKILSIILAYFPSIKVAKIVGLSRQATGKVTLNFIVITLSGQKNNIGLSCKFKVKALKVIEYL
ncbi:hypothetical protein PILCRDRAFT_73722, partial [Piloderma croceum F 1598]